ATPGGRHERVLARPTANVQHGASHQAGLGELEERGLRAVDVPAWFALINGVEVFRPSRSERTWRTVLALVAAHGAFVSPKSTLLPRGDPDVRRSGCPGRGRRGRA